MERELNACRKRKLRKNGPFSASAGSTLWNPNSTCGVSAGTSSVMVLATLFSERGRCVCVHFSGSSSSFRTIERVRNAFVRNTTNASQHRICADNSSNSQSPDSERTNNQPPNGADGSMETLSTTNSPHSQQRDRREVHEVPLSRARKAG